MTSPKNIMPNEKPEESSRRLCLCIDLQQLVSGADPTHKLARCDAQSSSAMGHFLPKSDVGVVCALEAKAEVADDQ